MLNDTSGAIYYNKTFNVRHDAGVAHLFEHLLQLRRRNAVAAVARNGPRRLLHLLHLRFREHGTPEVIQPLRWVERHRATQMVGAHTCVIRDLKLIALAAFSRSLGGKRQRNNEKVKG